MPTLKKETFTAFVNMLDQTKELVIDLPTDNVKPFKTRVSQIRHYLGHEGRCSYKVIKETEGVTSLHVIVGEGKPLDFGHFGIREVEDTL